MDIWYVLGYLIVIAASFYAGAIIGKIICPPDCRTEKQYKGTDVAASFVVWDRPDKDDPVRDHVANRIRRFADKVGGRSGRSLFFEFYNISEDERSYIIKLGVNQMDSVFRTYVKMDSLDKQIDAAFESMGKND